MNNNVVRQFRGNYLIRVTECSFDLNFIKRDDSFNLICFMCLNFSTNYLGPVGLFLERSIFRRGVLEKFVLTTQR